MDCLSNDPLDAPALIFYDPEALCGHNVVRRTMHDVTHHLGQQAFFFREIAPPARAICESECVAVAPVLMPSSVPIAIFPGTQERSVFMTRSDATARWRDGVGVIEDEMHDSTELVFTSGCASLVVCSSF